MVLNSCQILRFSPDPRQILARILPESCQILARFLPEFLNKNIKENAENDILPIERPSAPITAYDFIMVNGHGYAH